MPICTFELEGIGIAIHYGDAILSNIGGPMKKDYILIGDVVNTASRLESKNKDYHSLLLRGKHNLISIYILDKKYSSQSSEVKSE